MIQEPLNPQSWNAYTYVFNNPLAYTDPSGNITFRQVLGIVIAIVGAVVLRGMDGEATVKLGVAMAFGFAAGYVSTGTLAGGVWGAFTAAVSFGIGNAANMTGGEQLFARAMAGGVLDSLQGGKFGNGFVAAGLTAMFMPQLGDYGTPVRTAVGALIGGTISVATGGKFVNGAISGAIQGAMMGSGRLPQPAQTGRTGTLGDPDPEDWVKGEKIYTKANAILIKAGFYKRGFAGAELDAMRTKWGELMVPLSDGERSEIGIKLYWQKSTGLTYFGPAHSSGQYHTVNLDKYYRELTHPSLTLSEELHTHPTDPRAIPDFSTDDYLRAEMQNIDMTVFSRDYRYDWNYDKYIRDRVTKFDFEAGKVNP